MRVSFTFRLTLCRLLWCHHTRDGQRLKITSCQLALNQVRYNFISYSLEIKMNMHMSFTCIDFWINIVSRVPKCSRTRGGQHLKNDQLPIKVLFTYMSYSTNSSLYLTRNHFFVLPGRE